MSRSPSNTMVVLPSVPVAIAGDELFMDIKAVDGMRRYAAEWPGPVRCLMRSGNRSRIGYGKSYIAADLPFSVEIVPEDLNGHDALFADVGVILASGDNHRDFDIVRMTKSPVIFIIEYILATRLRILQLNHGLSVQTLKSMCWSLLSERKRLAAFAGAAGLQANGRPAFDAYRAVTPAPLLFFDNRMSEAQQATRPQIDDKATTRNTGRPLRLAFSGRLERLKGADHLIPVITTLSAKGLEFTFDIFGDGNLRNDMQSAIDAAGLGHKVVFHGAVPFDEVLVPYLKQHIDLFVCCHRQSDPSCTYIETLACGVPIFGYDNAAFRGIMKLGEVGKYVPMDKPKRLADAVADIDRARDALTAMSIRAGEVSRQHSFEATFARRVEHLKLVAGIDRSAVSPLHQGTDAWPAVSAGDSGSYQGANA